jgi:biopolymer transport protein ExbB/TolQ
MAAEGGWIGWGVALARYVLVGFSVVSVAVMIERALSLRAARRAEETDYVTLKEALLKGQERDVRAFAAASRAPSAAALQAGLGHPSLPGERVREIIGQEVAVQTARLARNLSVLATIASTAPYVGLFGTVLGILLAFRRIAATGETGAAIVAGGISEALIATGFGLGVAIPAVIAYNYFASRVNDLGLRIETHALDLAARLPSLSGGLDAGR